MANNISILLVSLIFTLSIFNIVSKRVYKKLSNNNIYIPINCILFIYT